MYCTNIPRISIPVAISQRGTKSRETPFFDTLKSHQLSSLRGLPGRQISTTHECIIHFLLGKGCDFLHLCYLSDPPRGVKNGENMSCLTWQLAFHHGLTTENSTIAGDASHMHVKKCLDAWKHEVLPSQVMQVSAPTISKKYHKWYTWYQHALQTY